MFPSASRLVRTTNTLLNASSNACATATRVDDIARRPLPPIRYHTFVNPLPYPIGLRLQNDIIDSRLRWKEKGGGGKDDVVLFLEHTPTYTTGRRDSSPNRNTLHPEEIKVQNVGAKFHITKRGGQVTYHGPGQLVGYPIMDLNAMEIPTRCYVDWLQGLLADYTRQDLACEGILAPHPDGHVGVFGSSTEKVASIGIHLRHRITSHGFAINVDPTPLKWLDLILACGLADVKAICLHDLMERSASANGLLPPSVRDVASSLVPRFERVFGREMVKLDGEETSGAERDDGEEIAELRVLVRKAEDDAKVVNEKEGGWLNEPDLSKRIS